MDNMSRRSAGGTKSCAEKISHLWMFKEGLKISCLATAQRDTLFGVSKVVGSTLAGDSDL